MNKMNHAINVLQSALNKTMKETGKTEKEVLLEWYYLLHETELDKDIRVFKTLSENFDLSDKDRQIFHKLYLNKKAEKDKIKLDTVYSVNDAKKWFSKHTGNLICSKDGQTKECNCFFIAQHFFDGN
jgi:hypothetical protein